MDKKNDLRRFPSYIDDPYKRMMNDMILGRYKPQNKEEQELMDDINEIAKEGGIVGIPANT